MQNTNFNTAEQIRYNLDLLLSRFLAGGNIQDFLNYAGCAFVLSVISQDEWEYLKRCVE